MSEVYRGTKFRTVFTSKQIPTDEHLDELCQWCRKFAELGLAPYQDGFFAGNMSIRSGKGIIITTARANLGDLKAGDFTLIIDADIDNNQITASGLKEPSSESLMHIVVYRAKPHIKAQFHGHDDLVLKKTGKLGLPITKIEQPYGTVQLANEVLETLEDHTFVIIRNHGFLSLGRDMKEAGDQAIRYHNLARQLCG